MSRKSQITIFVLLGLVLLISFGFILYLNNSENGIAQTEKSSEIALDVSSITSSVKIFVESCLDSTAKNGIYHLGFRGGYYDVIGDYYEFPYAKIPYYFYLGKDLVPEKEVIGSELSRYVKDNILNCISDFEGFSFLGYKLQTGDVSVATIIGKDNIFVQEEYPIEIIKDSSIINLNKFNSIIDLNFEKKYNIIKGIIKENKKNPDSIPMGYITDIGYRNNFTFDIIDIRDGNVLYTLIFKEPDNSSFVYLFMAKYNWKNLTSDKHVEISKIGEQKAYTGYLFTYKVNATDENLQFYDYTDLFDIDKNSGLIEFTPKISDKDTHTIMIKAFDDLGHEDIEVFNLQIISENKPPMLNYIEDKELKIGEELKKFVNASDLDNDQIIYAVQTSLHNFRINPITGLMEFKPTANQTGRYTITIMAVDKQGEFDKKTFNLNVKK